MAITFYTLDVGHGLCQIIRFGERAILIDGGGGVGKRVAEDFLKRYIRVIVAYVATHNDADHVGAAPELLDHYSTPATLKSAWMLLDRPARRPQQRAEEVIPLFGYLKRREEDQTIGKLVPLFVSNGPTGSATLVHREDAERAELQLIFPKLFDAAGSFLRGQSDAVATNQSSAILRLVLDGSSQRASALITGDANCESFRVAREVYRLDLSARVLAVPHHGGQIPVPPGSPDWATVVGWIKPEIAVVSAGFGRVPQSTVTKRATFDPLRQHDAVICCTQLTKHCNPSFASLHPSVISISGRPVPQMSGQKDFPEAVGCAGTIAIRILSDGTVKLVRRDEHQAAVNQKVVPTGCPHCR